MLKLDRNIDYLIIISLHNFLMSLFFMQKIISILFCFVFIKTVCLFDYFLDCDLIDIQINKEEKMKTKVFHYFVHNKFCKIMNFRYCILPSSVLPNEEEIIVCKILLLDDAEKDFIIKDKSKKLLNKQEWYIKIRNNNKIIHPIKIEKKEPALEDVLLFGERCIPFGTLFEVKFLKKEFQDNCSSFLTLYQDVFAFEVKME